MIGEKSMHVTVRQHKSGRRPIQRTITRPIHSSIIQTAGNCRLIQSAAQTRRHRCSRFCDEGLLVGGEEGAGRPVEGNGDFGVLGAAVEAVLRALEEDVPVCGRLI